MNGIFTDTDGQEYRKVAGVLRHAPGFPWAALNDAGHEPLNIISVSIDGDDLEVTFPDFSQIVTAFVTADETFSRAGYTAGISVALNRAIIRFTRNTSNGPVAVDAASSALVSSSGNFWLCIEGTT